MKTYAKLLSISLALILTGGALTALGHTFLLITGIIMVVAGSILFIYTYWFL